MIQYTHNTHDITSLPLSSSYFLSSSLQSCPIIFIPTFCMSQMFCCPTEVCQLQIILIKDNLLSIHYELPPSSKITSVRELRGALGYYTHIHIHINLVQVFVLISNFFFFCSPDFRLQFFFPTVHNSLLC